MDYTYADIPSEYFDRINKAFLDVMAQGTGSGIPFTFPLISVQIDDNFDFNNEMFLYLLEKIYYFGGAYFENFKTAPFDNEYYKSLNPYIKAKDPSVSRSLCCRLQIDLSMLKDMSSGGIFGSSVGNVGAIQVIDINLNRLFFEFGHNMDLLKSKVRHYMELIQQGHLSKRKWIEQNKELFPTFFAFNDNLKNYFNVFGVVGTHEGLVNIGYKNGLNDEDGKRFAHEVMQYMREVVNEFIERDGVPCGVEASPAENAAIKLSRNDKKYAKSIGKEIFLQGSGEDTYMTSGCMIPFSEDNFMLQIENAAEFQSYFTSGSILHHFVESKVSPQKLSEYLNKLFEKPINYITLTPTLTSCMSCGHQLVATDGKEIAVCPICESDDIATFSRIIGYVKMISRKNIKVTSAGQYKGDYNFWSKARRYDWAERKRVKESDLI